MQFSYKQLLQIVKNMKVGHLLTLDLRYIAIYNGTSYLYPLGPQVVHNTELYATMNIFITGP